MDARKEGAPVIAIAGDVETSLIDTAALEELNPYKFFDAAALYIGRLVNPEQARAVINTAITTAIGDRGPTVISLPGDVAASEAPDGMHIVATSRQARVASCRHGIGKARALDQRCKDGCHLRRRRLPGRAQRSSGSRRLS